MTTELEHLKRMREMLGKDCVLLPLPRNSRSKRINDSKANNAPSPTPTGYTVDEWSALTESDQAEVLALVDRAIEIAQKETTKP